MIKPNKYYADLKNSYFFTDMEKKVETYSEEHPDAYICNMGIGDVSLPLSDIAIEAMHRAVDDQADKESFQGYMFESGLPFYRRAVRDHYLTVKGVELETDEIFVSSGAGDDLSNILDLFARECDALIVEPAYPAYVDTTVMEGRKVRYLVAREEDGFVPLPDEDTEGDLIYICSPNNPTGAVYGRDALQAWVDWANARGAVILFDAAYEIFIEDEELPHSIYEIEGAKTCAIEICSFSKSAGFTGTRLGYTVVPRDLIRVGVSLHDMWVRNRATRTNGISYILQRAGEAVNLSADGLANCYIAHTGGTYRFNAQVKGNGKGDGGSGNGYIE